MAAFLIAIEKPSSATSPILGTAGYIDSAGGSTFNIKLLAYSIKSRSPVEEISGDGDEGPMFDYVPWTYVEIILDGLMISDQALGISVLDAQTLDTDITVKMGSSQTFTLPGAVIYSIAVQSTHRGLFNRVQMKMQSTGQVSGTVFETA